MCEAEPAKQPAESDVVDLEPVDVRMPETCLTITRRPGRIETWGEQIPYPSIFV
jgi:hypothetical protein